jgi:hypothetical protein
MVIIIRYTPEDDLRGENPKQLCHFLYHHLGQNRHNWC